MRRHLAVFIRLRRYCAVYDPRDRVTVLFRIERRLVGRFTGDRRRSGIPTSESVSKLSGVLLRRVCVRRNNAVRHRGRVDERIIVVQPGDRIASKRAVERCSIGRFAGDRNGNGIPSRKRVRVLGVGCLFRRRAGVCGHRAVFNVTALKFGSVVVHESDRVLVDRAAERCRISYVAGNVCDFGSPSGERVRVLRCRGLHRSSSVV